MKLYEIDMEIERIIDQAFDEETGEVINEELLSQLEVLQEAREDKIEGVALWIKNLAAEAEAIKAEKLALEKRQRSAEKKVESLKGFLRWALSGEKFKTAKVAISYRKSESVEVDPMLDIRTLDERFLRYKDPEVNKTALKEALKDGEVIDGVRLAENISIQIK